MKLLLAFAAVALSAMPATAAETSRAVQHVVLVSIDGLAASYLNDARADLPNLRLLVKEGAAADGMITTFPSVTWPSHTSLITGATAAKHGVIGNAVWSPEKNRQVNYLGDPELTKDESIRIPTLYDVAHEHGLSTASVIWPCSNGAKTFDFVIPDSNKPELHAKYTTPGFADELAKAGIDISQLGAWGWNKERSKERDIVYTQVANYLLKKHNINLLLVHLITPDGVEHAVGPHTPEAYQAVKESDERIGEIWATLQKPPFAGKSTLFVVSDHGFAPYEKTIQPNVKLVELGLVKLDEKNGVIKRDAWCVQQGGSAFIYILNKEREKEIAAQLVKELDGVEGVAAVLSGEELTKRGLPLSADNVQSPQLVLTTGPGYSFNDATTGPLIVNVGSQKGTHGHDPQPEYMHATFVAAGGGIKPGVKLATIHNLDVAPTIAKLLGLKLKEAEGRVLEEILAK